jgi:lipoprotein-anchoring transpeptidase ErfK/SrfK
VATVATRTSDRTDNLVLLLDRVSIAGSLWVRVRLPVLPNRTTGWVRRSTLGGYHEVTAHVVVDRRHRRLTLLRRGHAIFHARVGVGKVATPTPAGEFYVRSRLTRFTDPTYGPLAFGLSARSAVLTDWPGGGFVGIHGTDQPGRLPGRVSHGCIRLRNRDVLRLGRLMPVGTPVTIR